MLIEILYFEGCPSYPPTLKRIMQVIREEGVSAAVSEVKVSDVTEAETFGFLGSPTIRVNAVDIEPSARSSRAYGMVCRTYIEDGKRSGIPSKGMIVAALREASSP